MMDAESPRQPHVYRLVWRWKMTGATGAGPWVRDRETVDALFASLSARACERADHWVEVAPAQLRWAAGAQPISADAAPIASVATGAQRAPTPHELD